MTMRHGSLLIASLVALPFTADAAGFVLRPVTVAGGTSPYVSAISGSGIVGGSFIASNGEGEGFLAKSGQITVLPNLYPGTPGSTPVP